MYIKRNIQKEILQHLTRKEHTIITGARQCGKTSLLIELFSELKERGEIVSYLTLEDREILRAVNEHPENMFLYAPRPGKTSLDPGPPEKIVYLFIDEIQYAKNPSNLLKYLYDKYREHLKIIATGSSAFYLDARFQDSLAGRKRIFLLNTLDFEEMLLFRGLPELVQELDRVRQQREYVSPRYQELLALFDEYLVYGGYPEVVLESAYPEKINLLRDIRDSFLKKDIDEAGITDQDKFYKLLQLIAGQAGNLVNRNDLSRSIAVDNKTIARYLFILRKCFHIELIKPFHTNLRKELVKMPKLYFSDLGLRNMAITRFYDFAHREDKGALLENYVFNRLRDLNGADAIRFWRTADQHEIDFIIQKEPETNSAIEVKVQCIRVRSSTVQRFKELYPSFSLETVSRNIHKDCTWVLKI